MSVFTSRNTCTIPIAGEPGATATIRQLAPRHLEMAAKEQQRRTLRDFREMGGSETMREIQGIQPADIAKAKSTDPLIGFDRETLILKGVTAWTLDEPLTPESAADLTDDTQEQLARAILQFTKPSLFETIAEQEVAQKNA